MKQFIYSFSYGLEPLLSLTRILNNKDSMCITEHSVMEHDGTVIQQGKVVADSEEEAIEFLNKHYNNIYEYEYEYEEVV